MRRTIKPFTVEVRSSRRKPAPAWPIIEDQPVVEWPAAMLEELRPEPAVVPAEPPRRVLPVLNEQPKATPAPERARLAEPEPEPVPAPPARPEPEMPLPAEPEAAGAGPTLEPIAPRPPRARIERGEFARGERWKARLPAAVHRAGKKRDRVH